MKGTKAGPEKLAPFHTISRLWINYYVELLIDFNGNKFAVRKTVIDGANKTSRSGEFNERILTLNGCAKKWMRRSSGCV